MSIIRVARIDSMKRWISAAMRSDCCCWWCCDVTLAHHTLGGRISIIYSRWTEQRTNEYEIMTQFVHINVAHRHS